MNREFGNVTFTKAKLMHLLLYVLFYVSACNMPQQLYDWHATACTPRGFPCKVVTSQLSFPDGGGVSLPFRYAADEDWGEATSIAIVWPDKKPVPDSLHILYFSFRERKFYSGEFSLKAAGIDSIFGIGYTDFFNNEHREFNEILVGMAPGGKVIVWIKGPSRVIELGMFQASETTGDTASLIGANSSLEEYVQGFAEGDTTYDLSPPDLSKREVNKYTGIYRQRYLWKPECHFRGKVTRGLLVYFNAELHYEPDFANWNNYWRHPIPSQYRVFWEGADHKEQALYIAFDEAEIIAAFESLGGGAGDTPLQLKLTINSVSGEAEVFLTDQKSFISLKKCSFH